MGRLACDPGPPHPLDDGIRVVGVQLELGREQHRVVERVGGVGQLVAVARLHLAGRVDDLDAAEVLADLAGAVADVLVQGAADGAGDADQGF